MNIDQLLGSAFIIGIVAAFWAKIKAVLWRIASLLIVRVQMENDASIAFGYWCFTNLKRSPFGEKRYGAFKEFVRPEERYLSVAFESIGKDITWFWLGWRPILVNLNMQTADNPTPNNQLTATTIRGVFDFERILISAMDQLNNLRHFGNSDINRFSIRRVSGVGTQSARNKRMHSRDGGDVINGSPAAENAKDTPDRRFLKWKLEDIGARQEANPWEALAFPPEIQDRIQEAARWLSSEKWYRSKRIPWRLGWLLYGVPGTGKTTLARAVAQQLDLPIIAFDLASFSNDEFAREWERLMNGTPCMAILEDMDAVFSKRDNKLGEEGGGLTFDCLLNCISGVAVADGVFVVITTNKIEEIDEALGIPDNDGKSSRPGRVDRAIELKLMSTECRRTMAVRILDHCPGEIESAIAAGHSDTGAQFQDRCAQIALANYWSNNSLALSRLIP